MVKRKRSKAAKSAEFGARHPSAVHGRVKGRSNRAKGQENADIWLFGTHAVTAALANPERRISRCLATINAAQELEAHTQNGTPVQIELCESANLSRILPPGAVHQGLAVLTAPLSEKPLEILEPAPDSSGQKVVVLDQVTDPHNVGAIMRSAAAFGAKAVIQQSRNGAPATGTLAKAASGALEWIPLINVTNLARALRELADWGYFRIGLTDEAEVTLAEADTSGHVALVLGAEGKGLRQLTRQNCDVLAKLPTTGAPASLNVSNAAAVALYQVAQTGRIA